ncbi:NUDIX hydrolase [uncultured Serinicoccus sp.]|uniref:NUDIX hydrolase n=1 Tax=uncultured Serinicoccus sp. TaxID=735514 RepID=UPI00260A29E4|nr:NUDIX hydrolase [uncultured Serinicoccus sp.]
MTTTPPRQHHGARRLPSVNETSAGGVVIDVYEGQARIAIIARRNRSGRVEWCLPKGHVEPGETLVQTAEREVAEETGIEGRVLVTLGTIEYWFTTPSHRIHKMVHHYLLEATGGRLTIDNDPDQEAIDAIWVPLDQVHRKLTFPNERRIAREAWLRLTRSA